MMKLMIDAHAHIFPKVQGMIASGKTRGLGYGRVRTGSEPQHEQILPPYNAKTIFTPEMLIANLNWAGVNKAVLLQGPFYGECNQYILKALEKYPDRLVGMAYLDPWEKHAPEAFEWICNTGTFRGIKT